MNLSIAFLKEDFLLSLRRFNWAVLFAVLLTAVCICMVWDVGEHTIFPFNTISPFNYGVAVYYCSVGMLLSLVGRLWLEDEERTLKKRLVLGIAHLLLLLDAVWLWKISELSKELAYAHLSGIVSLLLAMFFLPFIRERSDVKSWNFVLRLFGGAAVSCLIGIVMTCGLFVLLRALDSLFGVSVSSKWYTTISFLSFLLLSLLLWIGQIPAGEKKHSIICYSSRFLNGVVRFLFIPLLALYVGVLYVYGAKILLSWQLPNGGVVWLISVLMFGTIGVVFLLYPRLRQDTPVFEQQVVRWLPLVVLPLVFLMSVSLFRRFSDYGITTTRLYAALLNLWFYGVCLGLFVNRARRIHWIALSFGMLFLLSSVLPVNFSSWGLHAIKSSLSNLWAKNPPPQKTMNQKEYDAWLSKFSADEIEEISSRLCDIRYDYSEKELAQWVKADVVLDGHRGGNNIYSVEIDYDQAHVNISVPQGYEKVRVCELSEKTTTKESVVFSIDEHLSVEVPFSKLKKLSSHPTTLLTQDLPNGQGKIVFTCIGGHFNEEEGYSSFYNVEGILFSK